LVAFYPNNINRRKFLKNTGLSLAAVGLATNQLLGNNNKINMKNALPRWKGFNFLDFTRPSLDFNNGIRKTTEDDFRWMVDWGFDFVRLPIAYPCYLDFNRTKNIKPEDVYKFDEKVLSQIDELIFMAQKSGLHVSLNLHRAPGYCINSGFNEPFNLWKDKAAQDAFYFHWDMWAKRYKDISPKILSFDLLNEPSLREDMNDQHSKQSPVPGQIYRQVAMHASKVIRSANPERLIIADGNNVGNDIIPELEDLDIAQSCRGYYPHYVSHFKAPWAIKDPELSPEPVWPGKINSENFGKDQLLAYYKPWIELANKGIGVHCGECGCWKMTPHKVFLAWFTDVLDILTSNGIGYALWNFKGDFGILDSGRTDVDYEDWHGHKLDRKLLDLLIKH
jgi:aryl-phospho-beta-D-glucosidase BglC (GH1 family)